MTQKHNTHVRTLPPTNHSTTTNHEEKRIDSTDCPAATGRNCPAPFHQRGREKDGKGKDGNERLPAGSPRNHPRQIRISDHHGCRTFRSTQCPRQRDGQRIAQRSLQSRDRPLRRRPNQDAGCLHPAFPDKRTDSHRRTNACSLHHRCPPLTAPAILPQPVVHRQASGQCTGCRIHSRIYPAHRCTYHRGRRTFQRFRTDQPERMAQGSELLRQSPVPLHQRTEPDTERAEHPTGRSTYAILRHRCLL